MKANRGAAGVDQQTIAMFERDSGGEPRELSASAAGRDVPSAGDPAAVDSQAGQHEQRPLGIPTVRDRVVQTALRMVLEPIFERDFAAHSYGFRPGRGCKDALRRVDELLQGRLHARSWMRT